MHTSAPRRKLTPEEHETQRKERLYREQVIRAVKKQLAGWRVVRQFRSQSSLAMHTVEANGTKYKCTCQAFRIRKQGTCKHIEEAKRAP